MKDIQLLLKFLKPFKWQVFKNVLFNIISAIFALFVLTQAEPFLRILFNDPSMAPTASSTPSFDLFSLGKIRDAFLSDIVLLWIIFL